jgi:hypothetical protein
MAVQRLWEPHAMTREEIEARVAQLNRAIPDAKRYLQKLRYERTDLQLWLASRLQESDKRYLLEEWIRPPIAGTDDADDLLQPPGDQKE